MNIAFFGSPQIATDILTKLHKKFSISLVVTQPDRPLGRKQIITSTPVKEFANKYSIPQISPTYSVSSAIIENVKKYNIDLGVVVAYGEILKEEVLKIPKYGFINVHYSLLPKYRGASPVQFAILDGEKLTGVTVMQMDKYLDHGPIIATKKVIIDINDTTALLLKKLTNEAGPLLIRVIQDMQDDNITILPQNHKNATFTQKLTKQDSFIDFSEVLNPTKQLHDLIRSMYPWPIAWTKLPDGKRCKLISSKYKNKKVTIVAIQIEGKKIVKEPRLINSILHS